MLKDPATLDTDPRHAVRFVARRTGLSPHVLRAWERRYKVVKPGRSAAGQRLYSDADIARLALLGQLTAAGGQISQLARLPQAELERQALANGSAPPGKTVQVGDPAIYRRDAFRAIEGLNALALRQGLERATITLGVTRMVDDVIGPLLIEVGDRWKDGQLTIAQEHLASGTIRGVLAWSLDISGPRESALGLVVATPPGVVHEGGALMVAAVAAGEGWRVTYLGSDLPVEDIAETVRRSGARAVALSVVYPEDNPEIGKGIRVLGKSLPAGVALLVGGRAAQSYAAQVKAGQGTLLADLEELRAALKALAAII